MAQDKGDIQQPNDQLAEISKLIVGLIGFTDYGLSDYYRSYPNKSRLSSFGLVQVTLDIACEMYGEKHIFFSYDDRNMDEITKANKAFLETFTEKVRVRKDKDAFPDDVIDIIRYALDTTLQHLGTKHELFTKNIEYYKTIQKYLPLIKCEFYKKQIIRGANGSESYQLLLRPEASKEVHDELIAYHRKRLAEVGTQQTYTRIVQQLPPSQKAEAPMPPAQPQPQPQPQPQKSPFDDWDAGMDLDTYLNTSPGFGL